MQNVYTIYYGKVKEKARDNIDDYLYNAPKTPYEVTTSLSNHSIASMDPKYLADTLLTIINDSVYKMESVNAEKPYFIYASPSIFNRLFSDRHVAFNDHGVIQNSSIYDTQIFLFGHRLSCDIRCNDSVNFRQHIIITNSKNVKIKNNSCERFPLVYKLY